MTLGQLVINTIIGCFTLLLSYTHIKNEKCVHVTMEHSYVVILLHIHVHKYMCMYIKCILDFTSSGLEH